MSKHDGQLPPIEIDENGDFEAYLDQDSENYQIIGAEEDLRQFYRKHITPFAEEKGLLFMFFLLSRRKYFDQAGISQLPINRKLFSSKISEEQFVREIRKYEIAQGLYVDQKGKDGEQVIPNSGLAFYMTVNPLNEVRAVFKLQEEICQLMQKMVLEPGAETGKLRMDSVFKSCLHRSPMKYFKKLDVDTKEEDKITLLKALLNGLEIKTHLVIETCNGYHVVIKTDDIQPEANKPLYDFTKEHSEWISIEKPGALVVMPGTYQGGHLTRLVDWEGESAEFEPDFESVEEVEEENRT